MCYYIMYMHLTNVTIFGINLGKNFRDIYSGVKMAGMSYMPFQNLYVDMKEIVCTIDGPGEQKHWHGRIVVHIDDHRGHCIFIAIRESWVVIYWPLANGYILPLFYRHLT